MKEIRFAFVYFKVHKRNPIALMFTDLSGRKSGEI